MSDCRLTKPVLELLEGTGECELAPSGGIRSPCGLTLEVKFELVYSTSVSAGMVSSEDVFLRVEFPPGW